MIGWCLQALLLIPLALVVVAGDDMVHAEQSPMAAGDFTLSDGNCSLKLEWSGDPEDGRPAILYGPACKGPGSILSFRQTLKALLRQVGKENSLPKTIRLVTRLEDVPDILPHYVQVSDPQAGLPATALDPVELRRIATNLMAEATYDLVFSPAFEENRYDGPELIDYADISLISVGTWRKKYPFLAFDPAVSDTSAVISGDRLVLEFRLRRPENLPGAEACDGQDILTTFEDPATGLTGYQDASGSVRLPARYHWAFNFNDRGYAYADGQFIKPNGDILLQPYIFENGPDKFVEGMMRYLEGGKVGFVDACLKVMIPARFDWASPFDHGRAVICDGCASVSDGEHSRMTGGRWNAIDRQGHLIGPWLGSYEAVVNNADG